MQRDMPLWLSSINRLPPHLRLFKEDRILFHKILWINLLISNFTPHENHNQPQSQPRPQGPFQRLFQGPSRTHQAMRALPRSNMSIEFKIPPRFTPQGPQSHPAPMSWVERDKSTWMSLKNPTIFFYYIIIQHWSQPVGTYPLNTTLKVRFRKTPNKTKIKIFSWVQF